MPRWIKRVLVAVAVLALLALLAVVLIGKTGALKRQDAWVAQEQTIPVISTRGHFQNGQLAAGHSAYDYDLNDTREGGFWQDIPADIIVVIHGFNNSAEKASVKFRVAELSLRANQFEGAIVGFSWDANTQHDPFAVTGYREGRANAVSNGMKLAQFVADCRERLPQAGLHLIGYSMGARVALEALVALDTDEQLQAADARVDSVHLVGAAVDNEEVELTERYGPAIEHRARILVNYYSLEDNALGIFYPLKEYDVALGERDIEHPQDAPRNYRSVKVDDQLIKYNDELQPEDEHRGDNHSGCLGNIGPAGELLDDGIMDLVTAEIRELYLATDSG
jgi:pimeloyl-ACP methyl ester carboxylesterase